MKSRVYVDLDGVLADFRGAFDDYFGEDVSKFRVITSREWARLKKEWPTFWADLKYERHATDLWNTVRKYHPSILTAVPHSWPSASVGKMIWVKKMLPKFGYHPSQKVHAVLRAEKKQFAQSNGVPNILIDDTRKNVMEWEAAGGLAVHYIPGPSTIRVVADVCATHT